MNDLNLIEYVAFTYLQNQGYLKEVAFENRYEALKDAGTDAVLTWEHNLHYFTEVYAAFENAKAKFTFTSENTKKSDNIPFYL